MSKEAFKKQYNGEAVLRLLIGARAAFPLNLEYDSHGMTYRQWLIGQALAGLSSCSDLTNDVVAEAAIETADHVITILAKEKYEDDNLTPKADPTNS